nr:tumor necrosis factor receptor superfamily member 14 isoform X2 [Zootoca vivipara]
MQCSRCWEYGVQKSWIYRNRRESFCIFLATQLLLYQEASSCTDSEYDIRGECCPRCNPGYRVERHCTSTSSTTCVPCAGRTYTNRSNGLTNCFNCQECESGAHLRVKEECTYTKNTVCSCKPGYYCTQFINHECEQCSKHTISPPGFKVTQPGTETNDTWFVPCPPGTYSETEMSTSCEPWTNCSKAGMIEERAGTAVSNAVCGCVGQRQVPMPVFVATTAILILLVLALICGIIIWQWRKRIEKRAPREQEERNGDYLPVQENDNNMVAPMQETGQHPGEPAFTMA